MIAAVDGGRDHRVWRHSSRVPGFERCTSIFTPSNAASASASVGRVVRVRARVDDDRRAAAACGGMASISSPSWFHCTCSTSCPSFAAVSLRERDELGERRRAVVRGLPVAEKVQVGAGEQQDLGHHASTPTAAPGLAHRAGVGVVDPLDPVRPVEHEREPATRLLVACA